MSDEAGLGDSQYELAVYIGNRPDWGSCAELMSIMPLLPGQLTQINQACGNGWRKVFNLLAKLQFGLLPEEQAIEWQSWQHFRDQQLLAQDSKAAVIFGLPPLHSDDNNIRVISGKTHGQLHLEAAGGIWLDPHFAWCPSSKVLISPYFDYRQLTNQRLTYLIDLINRYVGTNRHATA